MTVREMLSKLDSLELSEWMAFFKLENKELKKIKDGPSLEEKMKNNLHGYSRMDIK